MFTNTPEDSQRCSTIIKDYRAILPKKLYYRGFSILVYMNFVKMCLGLKVPNYPFNIKQEQHAPCLTQKLKFEVRSSKALFRTKDIDFC